MPVLHVLDPGTASVHSVEISSDSVSSTVHECFNLRPIAIAAVPTWEVRVSDSHRNSYELCFELWRPIQGRLQKSNNLASSDSATSFAICLHPDELVPRRSEKVLYGVAFVAESAGEVYVLGVDGSLFAYCPEVELFQLLAYFGPLELQSARILNFSKTDTLKYLIATKSACYTLDLADLADLAHISLFPILIGSPETVATAVYFSRAQWLHRFTEQGFSRVKIQANTIASEFRNYQYEVLLKQEPNFVIRDIVFTDIMVIHVILFPDEIHIKTTPFPGCDHNESMLYSLSRSTPKPTLFWT